LDKPPAGGINSLERHLRPLGGSAVDTGMVTPPERDHRDDYDLVIDLINQSVADAAQLDLVATRQTVQPGARHVWLLQALGQSALELLADRWRQLAPLSADSTNSRL